MRRFTVLSFIAISLLFMASCTKEVKVFKRDITPTLPNQAFEYVNADWSEASANTVGDLSLILSTNGVTNEGASLGRVLFYDPQLSLNNQVSCSSCHHQANAFADPVAFSDGFEGLKTGRNSMAVVNPVLNNNLFWDSRAQNVEALIVQPIQHKVEMGMETMADLELKLRQIDYYPALFKQAFGNEVINEEKIVNAMSQFLRSMASFDSKYDQGLSADFSNFNELELRGKDIFFSEKAQCASCHTGANFSAPDGFNFNIGICGTCFIEEGFGNPYVESQGTANIGLDVVYSDDGRGDGQFKIPTLRNIELTGPYMHDGRYGTLEEVVEHYNSQIQLHNNLDPKFKSGSGAQRLNMSNYDKSALVSFLKTLTDNTFTTEKRFSDPFEG